MSWRVAMLSCFLMVTGVGFNSPLQAQNTANSPARVEVKKGNTWYRATVVKKEAGRTLVHYEGASADFDEWVTPDRIREAATPSNPRLPRRIGRPPPRRGPIGTVRTPPRALRSRRAPTSPASSPLTPRAPRSTPNPEAAPEWAVPVDAPPPMKARSTAQPIALQLGSRQEARGSFDNYVEICFSGPTVARAVLSYHGNNAGRNQRPGRLECLDLALGKSVGFTDMPAETCLLDFSPDGTLVLLRSDPWGHQGQDRLDIGMVAPKPEHVVSFKPYESEPENNIWKRNVEWARFVDSTHVLTTNSEGTLICWELPAAKALYTLKTQRAPALSPTRKYFAATVDKVLGVFESATGKFLGRLDGDTPNFSTPLFSSDGSKLAAVGHGIIRVWDFRTGKWLLDIPLSQRQAAMKVDWVADDYLLLDDSLLLDMKLQAGIWRYQPNFRSPAGVWGGKYWYVTDGARQGTKALTCIALPEPAVRKQTAALKAESLQAIKPGMSVTLEVNTDQPAEAREKVVKALTAKLKANGMKIADGQSLKLMASSAPGDTNTIHYHGFGLTENKSITVTDSTLRLVYELNGQTLWESAFINTAPHMIMLKKDQTIEQAVAEHRANAWKFFEHTSLPKIVPDLPDQTIQGRSKLTYKGAEPLPKGPPGREPPVRP